MPSAPKRIVILGCAGSGKTALARRLGREARLPVICLDTMWHSEWTRDDLPAFRAMLTTAHGSDAWVSDGNFAQASFDIRLPRTELIVWLERSRLVCAWRAIIRAFSADDVHRLRNLTKVLTYIRNFERVNRPLIEAERLAHGAQVPVIRLSNDHAIEEFMHGFRTSPGDASA